jgi:hypothetical protein
VSWDEAATGRVVLDASALETSPLRSVVLFHELAVPVSFTPPGLDAPLRIDYYDPRTQGQRP